MLIREKKKGRQMERLWRREYSMFQMLAFGPSWLELIGELLGPDVVMQSEGTGTWATMFSTKGSASALKAELRRRLLKKTNLHKADMRSLDTTGSAFVSFVTKRQVTSDSDMDTLIKMHLKCFDMLRLHSIDLWKTYYYVEAGGGIFEEVIAKYIPISRQSEAVNFFSRPSGEAHVMKIASYCREVGDEGQRVEYVKKNYPWIFSSDPYSPLPSEGDYRQFVSNLETNSSVDDAEPSFDLPLEVMQQIKIYQDMLYVKDRRDEYRRQAFYAMKDIVDELSRRLNLSRQELWHVRPDELIGLDSNREAFGKELMRRRKGYWLEFSKDGERFLSGAEAVAKFIKEDIAVTAQIKGVSGSRGIVRGKVQMVRSVGQIADFRLGCVLVATTTNPDYIPAMQKAVAFVTDEGGITSHAAIVAREINKPCIVGTKHATKVLKDGDEVEVDADIGVVKIIDRN